MLDEQGARPMRAMTDFDDAWVEVRRGGAGDRERALALLEAAATPPKANTDAAGGSPSLPSAKSPPRYQTGESP